MPADRRVLTEAELREQLLMLHEVSVWRLSAGRYLHLKAIRPDDRFLPLSRQPDRLAAKLAAA